MSVKFYKNDTDVVAELKPPSIEEFYGIEIGYCKYGEKLYPYLENSPILNPNDIYIDVYWSQNVLERDRYLVYNINTDDYSLHVLTMNKYIPIDENIPHDDYYRGLSDADYHTICKIGFGKIPGEPYPSYKLSDLPQDIFFHYTTNKTNVYSNNNIDKYGIISTYSPRVDTRSIKVEIIEGDEPYVQTTIIRHPNDTKSVESIYGILENAPKGKEFVGFAYSPYSLNPDIKLGENVFEPFTETNISWYERAGRTIYNLYPVYDYIKTPTEETQKPTMTLYKNSADRERVFKDDYLEYVGDVDITFRDNCDITSPTITLKMNPITFNYVYIRSLNRYYYVKHFSYINNNLCEVELEIDILMSYKNGIRSLTAFVDRNEFEYNENIKDNKLVVGTGYDITKTTIECEIFHPYFYATDSEGNEKKFDLTPLTYTLTGNGLSVNYNPEEV